MISYQTEFCRNVNTGLMGRIFEKFWSITLKIANLTKFDQGKTCSRRSGESIKKNGGKGYESKAGANPSIWSKYSHLQGKGYVTCLCNVSRKLGHSVVNTQFDSLCLAQCDSKIIHDILYNL